MSGKAVPLIQCSGYRYAVARQVEAKDEAGNDVRICICFIEHENGTRARHAINEDFIAFAGEQVIAEEVEEAVRNGSGILAASDMRVMR